MNILWLLTAILLLALTLPTGTYNGLSLLGCLSAGIYISLKLKEAS